MIDVSDDAPDHDSEKRGSMARTMLRGGPQVDDADGVDLRPPPAAQDGPAAGAGRAGAVPGRGGGAGGCAAGVGLLCPLLSLLPSRPPQPPLPPPLYM